MSEPREESGEKFEPNEWLSVHSKLFLAASNQFLTEANVSLRSRETVFPPHMLAVFKVGRESTPSYDHHCVTLIQLQANDLARVPTRLAASGMITPLSSFLRACSPISAVCVMSANCCLLQAPYTFIPVDQRFWLREFG